MDVRGVEMEWVVLLQDSREVRLGEVMGVAPCISFSLFLLSVSTVGIAWMKQLRIPQHASNYAANL